MIGLYDKVIEQLWDDMDSFIMRCDVVSEVGQVDEMEETELITYKYDGADLQSIRHGNIDRDYKLFKQYRHQKIDFAAPGEIFIDEK